VRTNDVVAVGLTAAQLTSLLLVGIGVVLLAERARWRPVMG